MTTTTLAQDKNGVSPTTISRPSGPGSLEGLGDAFQPALNTGSARYRYAFDLPGGVAGFTPGLALTYDSGLGFGPAGIGWTFDPGSIRRQTDKGIPRYTDAPPDAPDRFLGMDGEELVPLQNGYFLAKIEGGFVRCRRIGDAWEARTKNGTKLEFGLTDDARVSDLTGVTVYQWRLQRQTDTHGNVVEYSYVRPDAADRQVYLSEIRYGPGAPPWSQYYAAHLTYEDRPDPRTDYRSGFRIRTAKRLARVDLTYNDSLIRRYQLGYATHDHWSLLTTITPIGADGVSMLPTTAFGYAVFDPGDPGEVISAFGHVIASVNEPGAVFDNAKVDLIDLNADGLPDLLSTDFGHAVYLNRGVNEPQPGEPAVAWEGPMAVAAAEARTLNYDLSQSNVHLADMTGDGTADLVVTEPNLVEFFENQGESGWSAGQLMATELSPPPAPFGVDGQHVRTADLDFDKRIDIIKSDFGAYSAWFNLGDGRYSDEVVLDGAFHLGQFIDFADRGVELSDVNGDRLTDLVKITAISVVYFPSMGVGRFDAPIEMLLPDRALDDSPTGNLNRAKMTDINGDGLADLVVERAQANDLWFWLNLGNDTFAPSRVVTGLPAVAATAAVRWADINGNGTTDLVYGDSTQFTSKLQAVDLAALIAGSPHLNALTAIDNGFGRRTTIEYRSSTDFSVDAYNAGNPWTTQVPFPVQVVSRTVTSIGLDLDGYPDEGSKGDRYIADFVYRDGYYDPLEKQFRGFGFVKKIERGDERFGGSRAPTLVTRMAFHTGAPDGLDNDGDGQFDEFDRWGGREEEPLKGVELWHERTTLPDDPARDGQFADEAVVFDRVASTWTVRDLATPTGGPLPEALAAAYAVGDVYERDVRHAVRTRVHTALLERGTDPAEYKELERRADLDSLGNTLFEWTLGDLSNPADDLHTAYEYARGESSWQIGRPSRIVVRDGGPAGAFVSETRNFYDGPPFVGLPLGQIGAKGNLHRIEALISRDPVPILTERSLLRGDPRDPDGRVDTLRQRFDAFGNAVVTLDADATLDPSGEPDGNGHERRMEYDPLLHRFPIREMIVIGNAVPQSTSSKSAQSAKSADLFIAAEYDLRFGTPVAVSDFNGHVTRYAYDAFGRLLSETMPGDDRDRPTKRYVYDWKAPFSTIATLTHVNEGESADVLTTQYFDGLGRMIGTHEGGGPVTSGVTMYNPRGQAWRVYQPYFGEPLGGGDWLPPPTSWHATDTAYDALGRAVEVLTPRDADGVRARRTTEYRPLAVIESDGEDNTVAGRHAGTPRTLIHDGMDRLIEVREIETLSPADSGDFVTRYRYAMPDLLAEIEDANGNIKYMRYDGLGRQIFMNDPDRGHLTRTYDAAGNIVRTVDAKGQEIVFAYDGANRLLTEDYLDSGTPLSLERTPDVTYHYDQPSPDYPWLRNTRGQLAWVEDHTGAEFHAFDARARLETTVKRIPQPDGSSRDFTTVTLSDSTGREYQMVYPDGSVVRRHYDARGLLATVPGFIDALTYEASGRRRACNYANGVTTTYEYDPRLRLTRLLTQSPTDVLQDLRYTQDQSDNIVAIDDGRSLPDGDPRNQTAAFDMDNSYRLQRAVGLGYGTIDYDYDRLGNMVQKVSPDIADAMVDLGTMVSGGAMGSAGRIGRGPADPPGPHALTSVVGGQAPHVFDYDANGNMTVHDDTGYEFDFKDRLGRVVRAGRDIRYLYDFKDRRVIKRVDGEQTTYISKLSEIRGDDMIHYVFAGATRTARLLGPLPSPEKVTQRIALAKGWNLVSFQVDAGVSDPAVLLGDIAAHVQAVHGHDGQVYTEWRPGAGGTLTELLPNRGYWIRMSEPADLVVEGPLAETRGSLAAESWSLAGMPGLRSRGRADIALELPKTAAIWTYVGDEVGWRTMPLADPAWLGRLDATAPGLGYWIAPTASEAGSAPLTAPPGPPLFFHADHIGSTNVTTDDAAVVTSETVYYPFGAVRHESKLGAVVPAAATYGFGDKERDAETGLNYFEARYCGTELGRFASVDPSIAVHPQRYGAAPQMLNLYAYAANNPLRWVDPTGNDPIALQPEKVEQVKSAGLFSDIVGGVSEFVGAVVKSVGPDAAKVKFTPPPSHPLLVAVKPAKDAGGVIKTAAPVLKTVGNAFGVVGALLGAVDTGEGLREGDSSQVVGGVADIASAFVGLFGGSVGAAGAFGYGVGNLGAEQLNKHTSHYDRSTAKAHVAENAVTKITGNKTVGTVFGAATAGMESIMPGSTDTTTAVLKWIAD